MSPPPWCLICSSNSPFLGLYHILRSARQQRLYERGIPSRESFNAAQGTRLLCVVRVTSNLFLNAFTTISNSLPLQALSNSSRVGDCFLSVSKLRRSRRGIFSNFMLRFLCQDNPLDCSHSRTKNSFLTRYQLAQCLLPFQLLGRFTPTLCCTFSLPRNLSLQVSTVTNTLWNGLSTTLIGHRLGTELLLQCKPLALHFFKLCPQGQTCLCSPWSSWSFRMSSTEIPARECNLLSCVSAATCAHSPQPRSITSGSAAVVKTACRFRPSRLKAASCFSA